MDKEMEISQDIENVLNKHGIRTGERGYMNGVLNLHGFNKEGSIEVRVDVNTSPDEEAFEDFEKYNV